MQWLVLSRVSLQRIQGSCLTRSNELASHFPHQAGYLATGRLHCYLLLNCNFQTLTQPAAHCNLQAAFCCRSAHCHVAACLQLHDHSNDSPATQAQTLWKEAAFCGKQP